MFPASARPRAEMAFALDDGIYASTWNPSPNCALLSEHRDGMGMARQVRSASIPDVDAKTHAKISTGKAENKFGIPLRGRATSMPARAAARYRGHGVDCISAARSPIWSRSTHAFELIADLVGTCATRATTSASSMPAAASACPTARQCSPPQPEAYAAMVGKNSGHLGCKLLFEPGRLITGNAGILVTARHLCESQRRQDLPHRRCGDERPDPADAV